MATVAFIGLGVMGYPMAGHLKTRGNHQVCVYNRTPAKAQKWTDEFGGAAATTPRAAAEGADFVFCCVGNDDDLRMVTTGPDGAFHGMKEGAIFIDNTTASAQVARELAEEAQNRGCGFLDAPVSGGQAGAENGVLTVMVGGETDVFDKAKPVIEAYARMVGHMGGVGAGQLTKMVNQICIAGLLQGLSEGIHFGKAAGLDIGAVMEVISKGAAGSWQMENRHETMDPRRIRTRLCGRLDAQRPLNCPGRSPREWCQSAGNGIGRSVLPRGAENGRQPLGYVVAACPPRELT